MKPITSTFLHFIFISLLSLSSLISCSESELTISSLGNSISGNITDYATLSVSALSCASPQAELYSLQSDGSRNSTPLMSVSIDSSGEFEFTDIRNSGVDLQDTKVEYLIAISGCSESLSRPVTGRKNQNVSFGTTLIEKSSLVQHAGKKVLTAIEKAEVESLVEDLIQISGSSLDAVFTTFLADTNITTGFQTIFQMPGSELQFSKPTIQTIVAPASVNELATASFSVSAGHWHPSYTVAYIWKLDGVQVSTTANYNYVPSKTSQGLHTVELFIGKSDGAGGIDLTKAYLTRIFTLTVNDTYQPVSPTLTLTSATPTNSQSVTLSMNTGAALNNCDSFSSLALTEDSLTAPVSPAAYTITCTSAGTQTINYTLTAGDGVHTLRLWARDSSGNVGATPSVVTVTLDQTVPVVTITDLAAILRGGSSQSIVYSKSDATSGLASVTLQYAANGTTFSVFSTVTSATSPAAWTVPTSNLSGAKLRIVAADNAGNTSSMTTSAFDIDSTAPSAPTILRTTNAISNSTTVGIGTTCIADYDKILYSTSSTTPAIGDAAWETCAATKNFTVSSGDGAKTIYAFTKDIVGNISSSSSISMILDQTLPSVSLTSLTGGQIISGLSTQVPAINSQTISWSATDTNLSAGPITLSYSTDGGSTWTNIVTGQSNGGTYSWTVPSANSNQVRIRVTATDAAGNSGSSASTSNLTIDSLAPVLSSGQMSINGGAASSTSNYVDLSFQSSDALTKISQLCIISTTGVAPTSSSCSWINVSPATTGALPAQTLNLTNFDFNLGFATGTYSMYVFLKDEAGNISTLTSSGNGTLGQDKASINYNPGAPPALQNIFAANADSVSYPPTTAQATLPSSSAVYIKWKATSTNGFGATPVSLYYTTDDTTFTLIASNLSNGINGSCTIDANATGCYVWSSPTSSYYKVRVVAVDVNGFQSMGSSPPVNTPNFRILAGNTELGLGGSAASALFFNEVIGETSVDPDSFVITTDGKFIFRDNTRGLLITDPADGLVKQLIPETGTLTDGPLSSATLKDPIRLALDYNNRILVYDYDRIRRIDLTAQTITTIIGGGASRADGTLGTSFQLEFPGNTYGRRGLHMTVTPNNRIYFEAVHSHQSASAGNSLYYYDPSDSRVYLAQTASGTGFWTDAAGNVSTTSLYRYILGFSPATSAVDYLAVSLCFPVVGSTQTRTATLDIATGVSTGPHLAVPGTTYCSWLNYYTDRLGEVYAFESQNSKVWKLNKATQTWTILLGTGTRGYCADGTLATSCHAEIEAIFVNSLGQFFFMNRGSLRTLNSSNQVVTIFGQSFSSGDGGSPLDARVRTISGLANTTAGEIIFTDLESTKMRSFSVGGNISSLAGNGISTPITANNTAAAGNPGYLLSSGYFTADPTSGDIYVVESVAARQITKLNRSNGNWEYVAGKGATGYWAGDGLVGSAIHSNYLWSVLGLGGGKILTHNIWWNSSCPCYENSHLKLYDLADSARQSHFAGGSTVTNIFSADGTALASTTVPTSPAYLKAQYDGANNRWLLHDNNNNANKIRILPTTGATPTLSTLATLPRTAMNFKYVVNGSSQQVLYYCATNYKIYKYNLSTLIETELPIPATMRCQNTPIVRDDTRGVIIFTIKNNNMSAVAEISDTP